LPSSNTSDFAFIKVGTKNTTGQPFVGHTWIWRTHRKQELNSYLEGRLVDAHQITGWVNGNLYVATKEVLGILPIPDDVRISSGMQAYISLSEPKKHHFLAKMQGTRKAVLPVHTKAEKDLFQSLMTTCKEFNPAQGSHPVWTQAVKIWNARADQDEMISYKVCVLALISFYEG